MTRPAPPRIPYALRGKVTPQWSGEWYEWELVKSQNLVDVRDLCRRMAGRSCVPAAEAAVWFQLAADIDTYLDRDVICEDCGNDLAAEGFIWCVNCLESARVE